MDTGIALVLRGESAALGSDQGIRLASRAAGSIEIRPWQLDGATIRAGLSSVQRGRRRREAISVKYSSREGRFRKGPRAGPLSIPRATTRNRL